MLLRKESRGHEHRDLLAVHDRLERHPDGDLGLAVADVAADQPVHRDLGLHVLLDLVDGPQLVGGLGVREGVLELVLPRRVRPELVAAGRHARGVEPDQLGGDLLDRLLGPALALGPVAAAHLVQRGRLAADVAGDLVELVGRHVEPVARLAALGRRVLDDEVLAGGVLHRALDHLDEPADAVLLVHDDVAGLELQGIDGVPAPARHPAHLLARRPRPGEVGLGEHRQAQPLGEEAAVERAGGHVRHAGAPAPRRAKAPAVPRCRAP